MAAKHLLQSVRLFVHDFNVRGDEVNLLLAGICIFALVLSGGFVTALGAESAPPFSVSVEASGPIGPPIITKLSPPTFGVSSSRLDRDSSPDATATDDGAGNDTGSPTMTAASPTPGPTTEATATDTSTGTATGTPTVTGTPTATQTPRQAATADSGLPPLWLVGAALAGVLILLAGGAGLAWRRGAIESRRDLHRLVTIGSDRLLTMLVTAAASVASWLRHMWRRGQRTGPARQAPGAWLHQSDMRPGAGRKLIRYLSAVGRRLLGALRGLFGGLDRSGHGEAAADRGGGSNEAVVGTADVREPEQGGSEAAFDISAAWSWLAAQTTTAGAGARTPDEIARDAIDAGYPAEAVQTLLDAFRDVTYGKYPSTPDRREAARHAYEQLRAAQNTGGSES